MAFQPNAFFNAGFQVASFSIDAFQKCAFGDDSFQTSPCTTARDRSGYWRLFYYKMQEDALQEKIKTDAIPIEKSEPIVKKVISKKAPKPAVKEESYEEEYQAETLPEFKLKPIYRAQSVHETLSTLPNMDNFSVYVKSAEAKIIHFAVEKQKRRRRARRRAATFLLLAA